ncbi:hypothetical protein [Amycolatopsis silviterrae]|uniref:PPE domain-containing protein n=1 Tax=Amycolatopsis silviterrae TaxID=1656914 RepID=A0ABW5H0D4_9PSEU
MGFLEIAEGVGHWIGERIDDLGKFYSVALQGNTGTEAMPAPELAQKVLAGPGTSVWHEGANQAAQLTSQHHEASDLVSRMSAGLESAWTGRAADAAQTRIRALAEITSVSAAIYTTNGANLSDVAHGFDAMKTSLQPMPDKPPQLTFIDRMTPWDTDAEREINNYNAVAQHNVDRYQAYVQHARTGGQQLQTDYGRLDDFGGPSGPNGPSGPSGPSGPAGPGSPIAPGPKPRRPSPHSPEPPHPGHPPDIPSPAPPVSGPPAPHNPSAAAEPHATRAPSDASVPTTAPKTDEQTTTSGWTPPPSSPDPATPRESTTPRSGNTAWPPGFVSTIPEQGRTTGDPQGSKDNRTARNPQAETPTGRPARPGTDQPRPANASPRATPGSRGAPGIGGITPSRGKDDEAKDHHRKYGLDNDSAFTLTDEDGERVVDPRTGLPPTPPTIGG